MSQKSDRNLKAWLNYNAAQGNNWITLYRFEEMVSHSDQTYFETTPTTLVSRSRESCHLKASDLRHVYFTYMTDCLLIALIETMQGDLYLIHNTLNLNDDVPFDPTPTLTETTTDDSNLSISTMHFTDDMIDNYHKNQDDLVKKVETIEPLPQIQSVVSKLIKVNNIRHLNVCLTSRELKSIGIRYKDWLKCEFKKVQKDELAQICFLDFINIQSDTEYLDLFSQYIKQSQDVLNLTHNYSITPALLSQLTNSVTENVTQLVIHQNFQIDDFSWFRQFPKVKLLNFWYNHRIEQQHILQMTETLPDLEVFNLHSCCRVNIRLLIPLLKLANLNKLAIDDPSFWCQKSIHEVFILPDEWRNMSCSSLDKLAINSKNLTLDVLDYILIACPNLQQLVVDESILDMVSRNALGGGDTTNILTIHSWQNPNKGFQIAKKVSFKNMYKDTYNSQMFSESMLKRIKENREKSNEPEQIPLP